MTCIDRSKRDGFEIQTLRSNALEVAIVPELGAKIATLRCLATGRNWLWSPPDSRLFRNAVGDPFSSGPLLGADECFPTVAPCSWKGRALPDHGELWAVPWETSEEGGKLVHSLRCPISPFEIRRSTSLAANELRLEYELKNVGLEEEAFLWAFHPLLAIEPGDEIDLPASEMIVDAALGSPLGVRGDRCSWPQPAPGVRLDRLDFGTDAAAAKLFTASLSEGRAAIRNRRTGEALECGFDLAELDTVGLWINRGGWNGYHHVAIEPTHGAPDPLDIASRWNRCGRLAAGAATRWTVIFKIFPTS